MLQLCVVTNYVTHTHYAQHNVVHYEFKFGFLYIPENRSLLQRSLRRETDFGGGVKPFNLESYWLVFGASTKTRFSGVRIWPALVSKLVDGKVIPLLMVK